MTINELKIFTEDYFGVSLIPVDRKSYKVKARFVYYYTAYKMFPAMTLQELASTLNQNHATVIHAIKELPNILNFDKEFAELVKGYEKVLANTNNKKMVFVEDYDKLRDKRRGLANLSAKMKIKELKKIVDEQNKIIVKKTAEMARLKHHLKLYEKMCGI